MIFDNDKLVNVVQEWLIDPKKTKEKYGHISEWDTSQVTDMRGLFYPRYRNNKTKIDNTKFNENLSKWDVSSVIYMDFMFKGCIEFNQDITKWDVSSVENFSYMFCGCTNFNQDISKWNVSNVRNMDFMFKGCTDFNQDISKWDVSNVQFLDSMFYGCSNFNQDLGKWNVNQVLSFSSMFKKTPSFDKTLINNWSLINKTNDSVFDRVSSNYSKDTFSMKNELNNLDLKLEKIIEYLKEDKVLVTLTINVRYNSWVQYQMELNNESTKSSGKIIERSKTKKTIVKDKWTGDKIILEDCKNRETGIFKFLKGFEKFNPKKNVYEGLVQFEIEFICENHYLIEVIKNSIEEEWNGLKDSSTLGEFLTEEPIGLYEDFWSGNDIDFVVERVMEDSDDNLIKVNSIKTNNTENICWGTVLPEEVEDIFFKFKIFNK